MASPKSSVGSKSSGDGRDNHLRYYQEEHGTSGAFISSWVRRLHLRAMPSSPPPDVTTQPIPMATEEDPPQTVAPAAVNVPCSTGSGCGAVLGYQNTSSTHNSLTLTSLSSIKTPLFLRRLIEFHKEHPPPTDQGTCSSTGFGPFQVRAREKSVDPSTCSPSNSHLSSWVRLLELPFDDAEHSGHRGLQFQEAGVATGETSCRRLVDPEQELDCDGTEHGGLRSIDPVGPDSASALGKGGEFTSSRSSRGNSGFRSLQSMTPINREEEKVENKWNQQHSRLPFNNGKVLTRENLNSENNYINDNSYFGRADSMVSSLLPWRRMADNHPRILNSPCFPCQHSSKKHDYLTENKQNGFTRSSRGEHFSRSSGDATKFMDFNLASSHNLDSSWPVGAKSRCSPPSRPPVAGDQRPYEQHMSVDPWNTTTAVHAHDYISSGKGVTYNESSDDGASRTFWDPHPMHHNVALRQYERPASACPNESKEPFSFWNNDSFKRTEMSSSIVWPSQSGGRKRNSNVDMFVSTKSRKLGTED